MSSVHAWLFSMYHHQHLRAALTRAISRLGASSRLAHPPAASKVAVVGCLPHAAIVKLGRQSQAVPKPSR